jgi:hypothetical protein
VASARYYARTRGGNQSSGIMQISATVSPHCPSSAAIKRDNSQLPATTLASRAMIPDCIQFSWVCAVYPYGDNGVRFSLAESAGCHMNDSVLHPTNPLTHPPHSMYSCAHLFTVFPFNSFVVLLHLYNYVLLRSDIHPSTSNRVLIALNPNFSLLSPQSH